ncbi:Mitotic checkpoint serine/threonine-protein kinase [Trichinella pseudospiralis]
MLRHRYGDHYLHNEPLAIIIKLNFYHISISFPIRPSPVSTCGTDRKASQLTDVSMYRLAKVEIAKQTPDCWHQLTRHKDMDSCMAASSL